MFRAVCTRGLWILLVWLVATPANAGDRDRLIFRAETLSGTVVATHHADERFNPASVVKVGTSLWALDVLGPDHRFETAIESVGGWNHETGTIDGGLVVRGGGDPDFHLENAFLLSRSLNEIGVRRVTGDLIVAGAFSMGWENGVERDVSSTPARAVTMGGRLLNALDASRWTERHRAAWIEMCVRRHWDETDPPSVELTGAVRWSADPPSRRRLVVHRSNPLRQTLRRLNVYSNNDIIRIADTLGGPEELTAYLRQRLRVGPGELDLTTASGQGSNRMTARVVVDLVRELDALLTSKGLELEDILPVPGCDPGPTRRMFPELANRPGGPPAVVKTGTLTTTDGGVVVLAGEIDSVERGVVLFAVAATETGWDVARWRRAEQSWLLELIDSVGGVTPRTCRSDLPFSDDDVRINAPAEPSVDIH